MWSSIYAIVGMYSRYPLETDSMECLVRTYRFLQVEALSLAWTIATKTSIALNKILDDRWSIVRGKNLITLRIRISLRIKATVTRTTSYNLSPTPTSKIKPIMLFKVPRIIHRFLKINSNVILVAYFWIRLFVISIEYTIHSLKNKNLSNRTTTSSTNCAALNKIEITSLFVYHYHYI